MKINVVKLPSKEEIINAARIGKTSYHDENFEDIDLNYADSIEFLEKLIDLGHEGILEYLNFTFNMPDVSRIMTHQAVRKRIGVSYLQKSNRRERDFDAKNIILKEESEKHRDIYEKVAHYCIEKYKKLIERGEDPDEARRIIPPGLPTEISWHCNGRSLRDFLKQRLPEEASWEIRHFAIKIVSILIANNLGFLVKDIIEKLEKD